MIVTLDSGATIALGTTETAVTIGITDYSRRVTDDFGVTTVVRRGFSRRMSLRFALPFEEAGQVQARLAELRATPALWVADDRWRALSVRGLLKDFEIDLAVPPQSYCSMTIEGLAESDDQPDPGGDPAPEGLTSTLRMVRPIPVTDAVLTASSVAEDIVPVWDAATSYINAARVRVGHRVYESLASGNVGHDPTASVGKWIDIGPTNAWAMFDEAIGTATSAAAPIVVALAAGTADTIALLDVAGATARVQGQGYDRTLAVGTGTTIFTGLPGGSVTVTIAGTGTVSVGTLLLGQMVALGVTGASPTAGITDYSRKDVDDFGEVTIVQRAWSKRMRASGLIRSDAVDAVFDRIAGVRATPTLWIGDEGNEALTIYGFFKEASIKVGEGVSELSLSIEGLSTAAKVEPLKVVVPWTDVTDPDGTKPEDNATRGAPVGTEVGGRPAGDVIDTIDLNGLNVLGSLARLANLQAALDAVATLEGQPIGAFVTDLRTQLSSAISSVAADLTLVFAKNAAGTGGIINADVVSVGGTDLAARSLRSIVAEVGDHDLALTNVMEALYDKSGATLRSVFAMSLDGVVTGLFNTLTGQIGSLVIAADVLEMVQNAGGQPRKIFSYGLDGTIKMGNVEVDRLKVGTGGTTNLPSIVGASSGIAGSGVSNYTTILETTIVTDGPATIFANAALKNDYNDGPKSWSERLLINGVQVFRSYGGQRIDSVALMGGLALPAAGTYTVRVEFAAEDSSVIVRDRTLFAVAYYGIS